VEEGNTLSHMGIHILLSPMIVKTKFWMVTVTSPQLEYLQNFNLCYSFFTNESEISTEVEESSKPENSDDKTSDTWCKNDKKTKPLVHPWNRRSENSNR
jgi:hypothetical protein